MPYEYRELLKKEFTQALEIRMKVFVEEQNVPSEEEHDAFDSVARHFGVFYDGRMVGTGRLVVNNQEGKIGRVAISKTYRGLGLGQNLIQTIIAAGKRDGLTNFVLGAQLQALGFYELLGFKAEGDVFQDGGIPHRTMRLNF